jgi:hypothetical protein
MSIPIWNPCAKGCSTCSSEEAIVSVGLNPSRPCILTFRLCEKCRKELIKQLRNCNPQWGKL